MSNCNKCSTPKCPNRGEINVLEKRIKDILAGYSKDKKYWRSLIKYMGIAIAVLLIELILTLAYGHEGITMGINYISKFTGR